MNNFNNFQFKFQLFWSVTWIYWVNLKGILGKNPSVHIVVQIIIKKKSSKYAPIKLFWTEGVVSLKIHPLFYISNLAADIPFVSANGSPILSIHFRLGSNINGSRLHVPNNAGVFWLVLCRLCTTKRIPVHNNLYGK